MDASESTIPPRRIRQHDFTDHDATIPPRRIRQQAGNFTIGDVIADRYQVTALLGRGAMGIVYRCFDQTASVDVALKGLPPELSGNEWEMAEIKRNFQLVHNLHHPNIASYNTLEFDRNSGSWFLVMEYIDGIGLRQYCTEYFSDHASIINVLSQIASALDYAHSQQILHRDIKPGNIMVDYDGVVKILDFGLAAQIQSSMTRISMAQGSGGTAPYMSPEQWQGRQLKAASDQYSLAVMAYELFAGFLPFDCNDPMVLQQAVLTQKPEVLKNVTPAIQYAVDRALSKDPADRFENCTAFVEALTAPVSTVCTAVVPVPVKRQIKWGKIAVIAAIALLLSVVGIVVSLTLKTSTPAAVSNPPDREENNSASETEETEDEVEKQPENNNSKTKKSTAANKKSKTKKRTSAGEKYIDSELKAAKEKGIIFSDDNKTLVKCPTQLEGKVIIPSCVTTIWNQAFYNCKITEVIIPDSVEIIGNQAFYKCNRLTKVTIGQNVKRIGQSAFKSTALTSIILPESVKYIGEYAFEETALTSIVIPDSVEEIDDCAFYACSKLANVTIGKNVKRIGQSAFNSTALLHVIIPDSVETIGYKAFYYCSSLTEVTVGKKVKDVGAYAFSKTALIQITIPENVENIGSQAFLDCRKLSYVKFGNGIKNIGDSAFENCSGLTEVIIPNSVENIGKSAFYSCRQLYYVKFGNSIKHIGEYAFGDCDLNNLTIILPDTTEFVGKGAFSVSKVSVPAHCQYGSGGFNFPDNYVRREK